MKVKFINVGRNKANWEAETKDLTYSFLSREIKKHDALRSSDIDFDYLEETGAGAIYAGFRCVGQFQVTPDVVQ